MMNDKITHRLDGLNLQEHYRKVAHRFSKYTRRLLYMGFHYNKQNDVFENGAHRIEIDSIREECDFTKKEFNERFGL